MFQRKYWGLACVLLLSVVVIACGSADSESGAAGGSGAEATGEESADQETEGAVENDKVFTFAMSGLYPPFNYQEGGELVGFDVEIGQALAEKMGMEAEPVTNPWQTILAALNSGKFDAIIGSMAITEEREKEADFSNPYYESGAQIFVAEDNDAIQSEEDITGKKIGVVVSSTFEEVAKEYTDHVDTYDSDVTALQDLLVKGRLDAVITDELVGKHAIHANGLDIKPVGDPLYVDQMGIPVQKGNEELLEKINKALEEIMNDGTYAEISEKYFGEDISKDL
ncbi:MAG: ABC transporter substrate-binding protein [Novibacillus thermophilus]